MNAPALATPGSQRTPGPTPDGVGSAGDVEAAVERLLETGDGPPPSAAAVSGAVGRLIRAGEFDAAARAIGRAASPRLDYTAAWALAGHLGRCRGKCRPRALRTKLAVLAGATSRQLVELIRLFLFAADVDADVYEADYGVFRQEILDAGSGLYAFAPQVVFLATGWRDLAHVPRMGDDADRVRQLVEAELADWAALWRAARERLGCQIVQNNFDRPACPPLGNHEPGCPGALGHYVAAVNAGLHASAPASVTVHDLDGLSAAVGRRSWGDERFYLHAKLPCAPEHLPEYAHSVASVLLAQLGRSKKCLVLDLDNTVWGGVVGDDGVAGLRLGQGDAEGEGFVAFQRYVRALRDRGVVLAVCSKNDDAVAREAFATHPGMVLRPDDVACFRANWEDKAANLRAVADQLNLGLDALVFLDDNPAERAIVRRLVPAVAVPEVGTDPLGFVAALDRGRYFQVVAVGREDLRRTEYYRADAERRATASAAASVDEYLRSLGMVATIGPITPAAVARAAQLINKSNQFNLTTVRRTAAELASVAGDPGWLTRTVSLRDRFGDNGLVSVLLARVDGDAADVDTWVMSCRVLKRNVELLLLNDVCREAARRGLRRVRGTYLPTPRNALVRDHYDRLGFTRVAAGDDGRRAYVLELDGFEPFDPLIEVTEEATE